MNKTEHNIPLKDRLDKLTINFENSALEGQELTNLKHLLGKYAFSFAKDDSELGCCDVFKHEIRIKPSAVPCFRRPYRVSPDIEEEFDS
jgi:hypothetical protein